MASSAGKRNYAQFRSNSAEPELLTTKKTLIAKAPESEYQYKTLSSEFLTQERINNVNFSITITKDAKYEFRSKLRKPLLLPIAEKSFLEILENHLGSRDKEFVDKETKQKNLAEALKGFKKKNKLLKITEALENGNKNYGELAKAFKLSRQQIRAMDLRLKKQRTIKPLEAKKPKKLKEEHLNFLQTLMENPENCFLRLKDMKELLISHFNLESNFCSLYTIHKALKFLKITYKKAFKFSEKRNSQKTKTQRKLTSRYLLSSINRSHEIVFIDEVGFNQNLSPLYGYTKAGTRCSIIRPFKSTNYSVVAATTSEQLVALQIFKGSVKSQDFCGFFANLTNYLSETKPDSYVFLMDNASIHKSKIFQNAVKKNFAILYNAPYSPMLNCIEEVFSKWKNTLRKMLPENEKDLLSKIVESSKSITYTDCQNYFRHLLKMLRDSFLLNDMN